MRALLALVTTSLLLLAACGGQTANTSTSTGPIAVTLTDKGVVLEQTTVNGGAVTFTVKNAGTVTHELLVVKTDIAQDKIQVSSDDPNKMSEEGSQGETGDLAAGESKTITFNLAPGKYVLMCNQPGHYMVGMHIGFLVK